MSELGGGERHGIMGFLFFIRRIEFTSGWVLFHELILLSWSTILLIHALSKYYHSTPYVPLQSIRHPVP